MDVSKYETNILYYYYLRGYGRETKRKKEQRVQNNTKDKRKIAWLLFGSMLCLWVFVCFVLFCFVYLFCFFILFWLCRVILARNECCVISVSLADVGCSLLINIQFIYSLNFYNQLSNDSCNININIAAIKKTQALSFVQG